MTVAIISEYNPFHTGHKYQIDKIREEYGKDTNIIAIMSGNFTQRGEPALADKYLRAEWATLAGVNLVLELPFPYSISSAEFFASAAIKIITALGCVDAISFGSECGDADTLISIAKKMQSEVFKTAITKIINSKEYEMLGYPKICELAFDECFGEKPTENLFSPNNILAIEYIKAILNFKSPLKIHTLKRDGASYNNGKLEDCKHQSAMAIRKSLMSTPEEAIQYIPIESRASFKAHYENLDFPTDVDKLSASVLSFFRLNPRPYIDYFDVGGGLYMRLSSASLEAHDLRTLITLTETKKFTNARIRRGIWYSFFGVTSSDVKKLPEFTQVLALDQKGRALLKDIKKFGGISIITKPSALNGLSDIAILQKKLLDKADSVFQLTKQKPVSGRDSLRAKPFVKKC